jgi:hypothetical protein
VSDVELERRERRRRRTRALGFSPPCHPASRRPEALTGDAGATVGGVVAALVLLALATAEWPTPWGAAERRHRRLEARGPVSAADSGDELPWARYVAWAEPDGTEVVLSLIERVTARPSGFEEHIVRRLDPQDVAAAAEAMEELRAEAEARESRRATPGTRAPRRPTFAATSRRSARSTRPAARSSPARRHACGELAEQERLEQQAQAQAVAEALRRR